MKRGILKKSRNAKRKNHRVTFVGIEETPRKSSSNVLPVQPKKFSVPNLNIPIIHSSISISVQQSIPPHMLNNTSGGTQEKTLKQQFTNSHSMNERVMNHPPLYQSTYKVHGFIIPQLTGSITSR